MDPDPGGPKPCGSGSGSPTLISYPRQIIHYSEDFYLSLSNRDGENREIAEK
jgi:hypothetical protein